MLSQFSYALSKVQYLIPFCVLNSELFALLDFVSFFHAFTIVDACDVLLYQKMLNTLWVSIIIIILSILFYFVVQNEIRLLLSMHTIVAIKASIGVYGYNSSFILSSEWFMINTLAFSSSSSIKFFKWMKSNFYDLNAY